MAYSIMLDAGHGGQDPGAVYKGRQEKDDNLKLALAVGEILKNNGIDVSYTRTTDIYQTPFEKTHSLRIRQGWTILFLFIETAVQKIISIMEPKCLCMIKVGLNIRWLRIFWGLWEKWVSGSLG